MLPSQQKDLFGHTNQGENYDKFRPVYPQQFFEVILKNTQKGESYLDIACGTGQLLFELQNSFKVSVGIDISPKQIEVTQQKINSKNLQDKVKAFVCDAHSVAKHAEEKGVPKQFDLVTIGQALHWFDTQKFFEEVSQNLMNHSSGSIFAVTGYFCKGLDIFLNENDTENGSHIYDEFYDVVKGHFDCDRENLSLAYVGYDFTKHFQEVDKDQTTLNTPCSVYEMVKYLKTYSAYNTLLEKNKGNSQFVDPILKFEQDVNKRVAEIEKESKKTLQFPIRLKTDYFIRLFKRL